MGNETALTKRLGIEYPVIQAPMAGGCTTPALVSAVSNAGGLGFFAGGYLSAEQIAAGIRAVRSLTGRPGCGADPIKSRRRTDRRVGE